MKSDERRCGARGVLVIYDAASRLLVHAIDGTPCWDHIGGRILSIAAAPAGRVAVYRDSPGEPEYSFPVECLALMEDCIGNRDIVKMDGGLDGILWPIDEGDPCFQRYDWEPRRG